MKIKQVLVICVVLMNTTSQGVCFGFIASLLPDLRSPDSSIKVDLYTTSWIVSSVGSSSIVGYFLSSFLMEYYGRRLAFGLGVVPETIGWLSIYFAQDFVAILIGRILTGLTIGCCLCLGSVIIGEYSSPEHRGVFLNMRTLSFSLGSLLAHIVGRYTNWRTVALMGAVLEILTLCLTPIWPESPAWLARKKRTDDCRNAIFELRGRNDKSVKEFNELIQARHENAFEEASAMSFKGYFKSFTKREFLKPMGILALAIVVLEVGGRHYFPAYALDIIGKLIPLDLDVKSHSFYYTISIDVLIIASTSASTVLIKLFNTRTVLFATGFSALAVILSFSLFLFIVSVETAKRLYWIPLTLVIIFFILTNLACIPVPLCLLGEIFPLAYRGIGSSISGTLIAVGMQIFLQSTPFLIETVNVAGLFLVFGVILGIALLLLFILLPETKNRTLQEIENYIRYGKFECGGVFSEEVNQEIGDANTMMINEGGLCELGKDSA